MNRSLDRDDWLRAARLALLKGGVEAVKVATLARDLKVTKGSFYWHFRDRDELLEMLLREWEGEAREILAQVGDATGREALATLMGILVERGRLSEVGMVPSDAAIFTWAAVAPKVARRVERAETERIEVFARIFGGERGDEWARQRFEVLYLAWLGFVARGRRVPAYRKRLPEIAATLLEVLAPAAEAPRPPDAGRHTGEPARQPPAKGGRPAEPRSRRGRLPGKEHDGPQ